MTETIESLFIYLLFITDFFIIALFLFFFKIAKKEKPLVLIVIYCIIDFIVNFILEFAPINNIYLLYSFFTLAEYLIFAFFLSLVIKSKGFKKIIVSCSLAFCAFLIIYTYTTTIRTLDSIPIGIETILILIYSFYYLYEQINDTNNLFIYNTYPFWVVTGIMIYLAGSFFIYVFASHVNKETLMKYWFLTNVFYVVKNILFAIAILIHVKQSKNPHPAKLRPYLN